MSGNRAGGLKARDKNLAKDPHWYEKIGRKGGMSSGTGGFASQEVGEDGLTGPERARIVGALGGKRSKRKKRPEFHVPSRETVMAQDYHHLNEKAYLNN